MAQPPKDNAPTMNSPHHNAGTEWQAENYGTPIRPPAESAPSLMKVAFGGALPRFEQKGFEGDPGLNPERRKPPKSARD